MADDLDPTTVTDPAAPDIRSLVAEMVGDAVAAAVKAPSPDQLVPAVLATLENDAKPYFNSRTLISIAVSKISLLAGLGGYVLTPEANHAWELVLSGSVTLLGLSAAALFHAISTKGVK